MTKGELLKTLGRHGVVEFNPEGEKFDPNRHEAMFMVPEGPATKGRGKGEVMECLKTGYMLKARCLRPAQVGVVQDS